MTDPFAYAKPDPGWQEINLLKDSSWRSFISGEPDGERVRIRYYRCPASPGIKGLAWFGPGAQGPPGYAHGGSLSGVLDEAMGITIWYEGRTAVAAKLTINFRSMVRLGSVSEFRAEIAKTEGRKIWTQAELLLDGKLAVIAEGLFLEVPPEKFSE